METTPRVLARDVIDVFAEHFKLPKSFCRQVITSLKVAGRVEAARPVSPPVTPRALARIAIALSSPSVRAAIETERALSHLPLNSGDGHPTLEDAVTDIVEQAAGWRYGDADFRDGTVVIGHDMPSAVVGETTTYRRQDASSKPALRKFTVISNRAIAAVARELLPAERGAA